MSDRLRRIQPNRPDVLGYWPDSKARQSKYVDAINRAVAGLKARAAPVNAEDVRGKRRRRGKPQDASNTIKAYLKATEMFSLWMQGTYGYELDPVDVTRETCFNFMRWMLSDKLPNINVLKTRAAGGETAIAFEAFELAEKFSVNGEVNIQEIYEQMKPSAAALYDPAEDDFLALHKKLGQIVVLYKSIIRLPTVSQIRARVGTISSREEKDPLRYRYRLAKRTAYKASSASTYISALSSLWAAMTEGDNTLGGEAPLRYNPWRGPRGPFALARAKAREELRRKPETVISNAILDALLETTIGSDFEARRNRAAIITLIYTGIRAEELVGALRKDLVSVNNVLALRIFGKGDKYRTIPIYAEIRDAFAQLDAKIEEMSQIQSEDPDVQWRSAYGTTLLQSENAPLIPAMPRWGANTRDVDPTEAALEPLDTSGLRAILAKLIDRVRVYDKRTRQVRPLTPEERAMIHPHAFRHYAATAAREAGLPMDDVKRLLGHEDMRTTERYIHIPPRAVAQFGAYIACARAGAVMSPEESEKLRKTHKSALLDENIIAAPAVDDRRRAVPTKPRPKVQQEPEAVAPEEEKPISSPAWAYQPGEKLEVYLPKLDDLGNPVRPDKLPIGMGHMLPFRRGVASRLPWWAGRANRWAFEQMAPVVSYFQAFGTSPDIALKVDMQAMFVTILNERGPTAASAYAEWVGEILGYASAQFFDIMYDRGDAWISFDQPALASDDTVVRMHAKAKILEWFTTNATAAAAPVVRAKPAWRKWEGTVEVLHAQKIEEPETFESTLRVSKTLEFKDYFKLKSEKEDEGVSVDTFAAGTGKDRKRIRFRSGGQWKHAIVVRKEDDKLDPKNKAVLTVAGDRVPDNIAVLEVSVDKKTEKEKRTPNQMYPMLVDLKALPLWFFSDDPIGDLPQSEREALQDWLSKLQGTKISRVGVVSRANEIAEYVQTWLAMVRDFSDLRPRLPEAEIAKRQVAITKTEEKIRAKSKEVFGVEVDPAVVAGRKGAQWMQQLKSVRPEMARPLYEITEADWEKRLDEKGEEVERQLKLAGRLPPLEKRIFAYVQDKKGPIPITQWGIKEKPIIDDKEGLFKEANLIWKDGTIQHPEAFRQEFFKSHGTDSQCVVRRMVRDIWERKKMHDFTYSGKAKQAPAIHRDILHRHVSSLMAYLVPCPKVMELEMRAWMDKGLTAQGMRDVWENFNEDMYFKDERESTLRQPPEELRKSWLDYRQQTLGETVESLAAGILGEFSSRQAYAKPNAANGLRILPNLVSLVFAEFWPV